MKFSIIVPVYNVAPYLRACLDSVVAQTFADWECICVDDGSTDGSGAILDEYAKRDARFRVIHQANAGVSAARNAGIDLATGEWVTFLDADDMYAPRWLEVAAGIIDKESPELIRMCLSRIEEGESSPPEIPFDPGYERLETKNAIMDWAWNTLPEAGFNWLIFQRREAALKYMFPVGVTHSEDMIRSLTIVKGLANVCVGKYTGYLYRKRQDSAASQIFSADERIRLFKACEAILPEEKRYYHAFARQMWECLVTWTIRPRKEDWINRDRVRSAFNGLMSMAGTGARDMKLQWIVPYWLYSRFGMVWPIYVTRWTLKAIKGMLRR